MEILNVLHVLKVQFVPIRSHSHATKDTNSIPTILGAFYAMRDFIKAIKGIMNAKNVPKIQTVQKLVLYAKEDTVGITFSRHFFGG